MFNGTALNLFSLCCPIVYSVFFVFSIGFYQMAKIAVTPTIVVAEFILFQKKVSLRKVNFLEIVGRTFEVDCTWS